MTMARWIDRFLGRQVRKTRKEFGYKTRDNIKIKKLKDRYQVQIRENNKSLKDLFTGEENNGKISY